jgi:hypothetical protein
MLILSKESFLGIGSPRKQGFKLYHEGTVFYGLSLEPLKATTLFIITYHIHQLQHM